MSGFASLAMSRLNSFLPGLRAIDLPTDSPGPFASLPVSEMGVECHLSPVAGLAEALHGAHHHARGAGWPGPVVGGGQDAGLRALLPGGQPPAPRNQITAMG